MSYQYIGLMHGEERQSSDALGGMTCLLAQAGMEKRLSTGSVTFYASPDTPVVAVPGKGLVIGHMFTKTGSPLDTSDVIALLDCDDAAKQALERFWGEYLLVRFIPNTTASFTVTRDPSGGVRCIYSLLGEWGFVTSDISLATWLGIYRKTIDWNFIDECLEYPHVKAQRTGLAGVRELLAGCALRISGSGVVIEDVWSPWNIIGSPDRSMEWEDAVTLVRTAVTSVIDAWASIDSSILVELSGGLDSSIVAACLQKAAAKVTCSTLTTPVPGGDERQYAQLVADELGVELRVDELRLENMSVDYPIPSQVVTPRVGLAQHASNELKEHLGQLLGVSSFYSGAGGDTVFCYLRSAVPAADAFRTLGVGAGMASLRDLCELHQCTIWKAGLLTLRKLVRPPKPPCKADRSFLPTTRAHAPLPDHPWFAAPAGALPGDRERIFDLAGTQVFRDATSRGLRRPFRVPLLSQPVIEACLRVPSWMWIAGGRNRAVARSAFEGMLPQQILNRRSKGSLVGYLGAVYRRDKPQIRRFLMTGQLQARGLLDETSLLDFFDSPPAPRDQTFMRILDLCMIENWVRQQ
jgi:asparagine synthase (glutamine-hydrolysing)